MVTIDLTVDTLTVRLSRWERVAGLIADLDLPVARIGAVRLVEDGLHAPRGLRVGLWMPGRVKLGTWRQQGRRQYVVAGRGSTLVLELAGCRYDTAIVTAPDANSLAARLDALIAARPTSSREVRFASAGGTLVGTLTTPAGTPRGAVLLVAGSGPIDRDGNHVKLRLGIQEQLAGTLTDAGYATFRYDRRGVAASTGDFLSTGMQDNVDDARAAFLAMLDAAGPAARPGVVVGHSEGALLAASLAGATGEQSLSELDGVVLLACSGRPGADILAWQAEMIASTLPPFVRAVLRALRVDVVAKIRANHAKLRATTTPVARLGGTKFNALWFREFMAYDPRNDLTRCTVPVLAITGRKDLQAPPEDLDVIAAVAAGPVTTVALDDLSHVLRSQPGPATLRTYGKDVRRPIDPQIGVEILKWLANLTS